jgi:hypothetical protein
VTVDEPQPDLTEHPEPGAAGSEQPEPGSAGAAGPRPAVPPDERPAAPQRLSWRVPGGVVVMKLAGAVGLAVLGVLVARDTVGLIVVGVAAGAVGLHALRDILAPVRLRADGDGLTVVHGFAGRRDIPWREVERIRIDERRRFGMRSSLLEIDTGHTLHLFSASELGMPIDDVADALRHLRTGR